MIFLVAIIVATFGIVFNNVMNTASAAIEGAILFEQRPGAWTKTTELARIFGVNVYHHLRKMEMSGLVEHRTYEQRPGEHRGGRDTSWYRLKTDEHGDPFLDKVRRDV